MPTKPEELWHALLEYAAREEDREKLALLLVNINYLLSAIEERLSELEGMATQD